MRMKISKTENPQDWKKVNPNFIYNRFDLFCKEGEFEAVKIESNGNEKVLEYRITNDQAELGLWLVPITEEELRRVLLFITQNHPNVNKIVYKNGVIPFGKSREHNHFRIVFPETVEEMLNRISSKSRAKQRKKLKAAEEAYGKASFLEYDRSNLPIDIVEAFFQFKYEIRKRKYNMTAEEYLDRYHVSHCYVIQFGVTIGAIRFSCEQCPVVYGENFTYNPALADYSLGRAVFIYHLVRMVEKKHTELFFAGGNYEYKKHYGSIEETLYDCEINVSELDFTDLIAQDSLWGRCKLFLKTHLRLHVPSVTSE